MKAIILAGGEGTRLRPFTLMRPKCLLPLVNRPLLSYQFSLLKKYGIGEVVLAVRAGQPGLAEITRLGQSFSLSVKFSVEKSPLGTAGAVRQAMSLFRSREPFLVFNGDFVADFNLERVVRIHQEKKAWATIVLTRVEKPSDYGLVVLEETGVVKNFVEKPKAEEVVTDTINAGAYVLSQEVVEAIPSGRNVSIERETFPALLKSGKPVIGYIHYGYWLDVGSLPTFWKATVDILEGRLSPELIPPVQEEKPVGSVKVEGKVCLGRRGLIKPGVVLRGYVVIGNECYVGENCLLEDVVLFDRAAVRASTRLHHSLIGQATIVGANCSLKGAVIGDGSYLSDFSQTDSRNGL